MNRRARLCAAAVCLAFVLAPLSVHALAGEPDLSSVQIELADLPSGFRAVPDSDLVEVGGSAKQVGEALERSLAEASLQQYLVYASDSGDELLELVVVGPLIAPERVGMSREMADSSALADDLMPSFTLYVEQSEPRIIDTAGIGEASVGFTVDSRLTSDLATVTNILGVPWTSATSQFLLALRGEYVVVMMTQHVGSGAAGVDFLAVARHVDAHLAAALGLATPGVYRADGTFSPSVANNIPTIGDISTEPSVAVANLVLAAVAVIVLTIAMRLLNTTLVRHEDALEQVLRPARALRRWWTAGDSALDQRLGRGASAVRVVGVLLFYGVLFSFLEDGWRPWTTSGLFVLVAMTIAFGLVGTTDDMVELRAAHHWGVPARLAVKPALVLFAVGSVVLTKFAQLVPGLMIGTPEAFSLEDEVDERSELRLARVGLLTTGAVGLGAWVLATPLDAALDGSGGAGQSAISAAVTLLVLVFAVAVENLFANMVAFPGSEGATLRRHHRLAWWIVMLTVTALFFHTLINPRGSLAQSLESTNVRVALVTVVSFLAFTLAVHLWFRRRDQHDAAMVIEAAASEPGRTPQLPPPTAAAPVQPAALPVASAAPPVVVLAPAALRSPRARRHRDPVLVVKLVVTAVALVGLAALVTVVVLQDRRDSKHFDAGHQAYVAADCAVAIAEYDALLDDGRLIDTAGVVAQATQERAECRELLAIDLVAEADPAEALSRYADFVAQHSDAPLSASVGGRVAAMLASSNGIEAASEENCDNLDAFGVAGILQSVDVPQLRLWCADTFESVGRGADAYATAVLVLQSATDSEALAAAEDIVLRNPLACSDLERLMDLSSLSDADDALAAFLQQCMSSAAADPVVLADVQIAFLAHFPARPEATAVEGALIANYAACDHLAELRSEPAIAGRAGFLPTITLTCAQTAEFFQDYSGAVERYQWFIDNAPTDDRLVAARDGLARSLIAEAQQGGAGSLPQPVDTGGSGSSLASVVIYNDSPEELRIVMSGPESRIEVLAASATSGEYDLVGPSSCRTDVPMLELQVPSGVYDVLVEATSGGISPFTGTWTLGRGDAYASCFYVVTTFG